jgi:hypothetical protein
MTKIKEYGAKDEDELLDLIASESDKINLGMIIEIYGYNA